MSYRVIFTPEAEEQLAALYGYIAVAASPDIAARYTDQDDTQNGSLYLYSTGWLDSWSGIQESTAARILLNFKHICITL